MARAATGTIIERQARLGVTFAARFRAYGQKEYVTLGDSWDGYTREKADEDLANIIADVRRGLWHPERRQRPGAETFDDFADEWIARKQAEGLGDRTIEDYRWALTHLRPFFGKLRLTDITARSVDNYKAEKAKIGKLSSNSTNKTITRLSQILADAADYDLIPANVATGRKRRLKGTTPKRPFLEPDQLMTFLDVSKDMLNKRGRPLLTVLAGGGLRIDEALSLRRRNVNLPKGTLTVEKAKTEAGVRIVDLTPAVREELAVYLADKDLAPDALVFATSRGTKDDRHNVRSRLLLKAVAAANPKLVKAGIDPIGHLTLHGLRRTYASLRCLCGDDPAYTADQLGHVDAGFTLNTYAHVLKRRGKLEGKAREEYDRALEWARWATGEESPAASAVEASNG